MSIRDKMTPKTDDEMYENLKSSQLSIDDLIDILGKEKMNLINKLLKDKGIDHNEKRMWKNSLKKYETYARMKKIKDPFNQNVLNEIEVEDFDLIYDLLVDEELDSAIKGKWKKLLNDFQSFDYL